jgi:hypothetical protein
MAPAPSPSPPAKKKELHFYPKRHLMLWQVDGAVVAGAEAWGGEQPDPKIHYDVMKPRPTTPGRYVIHSYEPYRTSTWPWSKIRWGTKLTISATGDDVLYETGLAPRPWKRVQDAIPGISKTVIQRAYFELYGNTRKYDPDGDYVPDIWVFNDFGAMAVRYFRDRNANRKLDAGESLSGEMIHTTPQNEAQTARGEPVTMESSHGCIHVSPADRDRLRAAGAFDKGTTLIIHTYDEDPPVPPVAAPR